MRISNVRVLKAMSHPLRLILCTLGEREVSVQEIVERVGTSQEQHSQHLAILRDKGILTCRKDANRVYYRVGDARTLRLISMMRGRLLYAGFESPGGSMDALVPSARRRTRLHHFLRLSSIL